MAAKKESSTEVEKADNGPTHYPVPVNDKPLNQTQAKNLKQIVDIDFEDLMTAVMNEIDKMAREKLDRLNALTDQDAIAKAQTALNDAALQVAAEANDAYQKVLEKVKKENPGLDFSSVHLRPIPQVPSPGNVQPGLRSALNRTRQAHQRLKDSAFRIISREHRAIDRLILVQTISAASAAELMNDLPEAADIITLIRSEMEVENDQDIAVLLSDDFDPETFVEAVVTG